MSTRPAATVRVEHTVELQHGGTWRPLLALPLRTAIIGDPHPLLVALRAAYPSVPFRVETVTYTRR